MNEKRIHLPEWEQLPDIGLYMDQVMLLMDRSFTVRMPKGEMTKPMINNYVKGGLLPRPDGKKYDREHLAILLMIYVLKQALNMESIGAILKILCRQDVRTGYEQFRNQLEELEERVAEGKLVMDWTEDSREKLTLRLSIMAALCTIRTYWLLPEPEDAG